MTTNPFNNNLECLEMIIHKIKDKHWFYLTQTTPNYCFKLLKDAYPIDKEDKIHSHPVLKHKFKIKPLYYTIKIPGKSDIKFRCPKFNFKSTIDSCLGERKKYQIQISFSDNKFIKDLKAIDDMIINKTKNMFPKKLKENVNILKKYKYCPLPR